MGRRGPASMPLWLRIVTSIERNENGCWVWQKKINNMGYGHMGVQRKLVYPHRISYVAFVGPIPDGLVLDHLCKNPPCCNPDHLEPVTERENLRRGDGWPGVNARKTHCIRGHAFDERNTRIEAGSRKCRACCALYQRKLRADRKAAA
jgi:hypothetical protein